MKKNVIFFVMAALLTAAIFSACKKSETGTPADTPPYLSELKLLSGKYLAGQPAISQSQRFPRWLAVLGADLLGAVVGAVVGSPGGPIVAATDAVIGGTCASVAAAAAVSRIPPVSGFNPLANLDNPEDIYGREHYLCINKAAEKPENYLENGVYSNKRYYTFATGYFISKKLLPDNCRELFPLSSCDNVLREVSAYENKTLKESIADLYKKGKVNKDVYDVLVLYFDCVDHTEDVDAFVAYSVNAEKIVQSSGMKALDKKTTLIVMSTGRYGSQYWGK